MRKYLITGAAGEESIRAISTRLEAPESPGDHQKGRWWGGGQGSEELKRRFNSAPHISARFGHLEDVHRQVTKGVRKQNRGRLTPELALDLSGPGHCSAVSVFGVDDPEPPRPRGTGVGERGLAWVLFQLDLHPADLPVELERTAFVAVARQPRAQDHPDVRGHADSLAGKATGRVSGMCVST